MASKSTRTPGEVTQIAVMANDLKYVVRSVDDLNKKIDNNYVTKDVYEITKYRLSRLEKIVYGTVSVVGTAILGGIIKYITRRP